jgi:heptosyltransferase-1
MRVLIIKTSSLGDIIHALPVLDYLHQVSPGIIIDWAVEEQFSELLSGNPLVSKLRVVRSRRWRRRPLASDTIQEILAFMRELRQQPYDLVFDIQGNLKSGIIAWATGAAQRVGFSREFLQESVNAWFMTNQIPIRTEDDSSGGRCLRIVSVPFDRDYQGMEITTDIFTSPDDDAAAEALTRSCGSGPILLFHGGTTWQTKFWSENGWIELGKLICSGFPESTILLSWGNESERQSAEQVSKALGSKARVLDKYSLKGIAAVIKKVHLVIGGDTGLIHLAAAVGTPTVSYYRASDGSVSGPRGSSHIIVQSPLACTRCQNTCCDDDAECRSSITADMLFAGVRKILVGPSL